jgi:hypothetical protein
VGANAALILLMMRGLSDDAGPWLKRIARVSLGLLLYFGADGIAELILEPTGLESIAFIDIFVRSAVLVSVSVYGAHSVSDWLAARV